MHSKSLTFKHLTHRLLLVREGITRIKAGKYTKKIRNCKVFTLIFKHLRIFSFTQQMLAHLSLPTLRLGKPHFKPLGVKRQVMYISTSSPRTTSHIKCRRHNYTAHRRSNHRATSLHSTTYDLLHEIFLSAHNPSSCPTARKLLHAQHFSPL